MTNEIKSNSKSAPDTIGSPIVDRIQDGQPQPLGLPIPPGAENKPDADVYNAWKKHMISGYEQNRQMFKQVLDGFMRPYWMTVWMYRVMFLVGIGGFILAIILGVWKGIQFSLLFGGLSVATFLTYFISQPLRSLEQNIQFITWLGIIYNSYWTRLMYANETSTIQADLEGIVNKSIEEIMQMVDKHSQLVNKRPDIQPKD